MTDASETKQSALDILYLGVKSGTSLHRAKALSRLGHNVRIIDPRVALPDNRFTAYWVFHTGGLGFGSVVENHVKRTVESSRFDVVWIDSGEVVSPGLVRRLKQQGAYVLNYNVDDPFGTRDGARWRLYRKSVPEYDLVVVMRDFNVPEAYRAGAKDVMRVHRSADEVAHAYRNIPESEFDKWKSDIAFVGTWMPERGPFFARLIELGVPLSIWGDRWQKAPEWPVLRNCWRGPGLYNDDDYAKAIQCAKVCIGMLSKGNRDLVTQRSFEIPHLGSVLCAERTREHVALYKDGEEAVFWNDPEECAGQCRRLLADTELRRRIARNGQKRHLRNGTTNTAVLQRILDHVSEKRPCSQPVEAQGLPV
jgi:spore maturation protein CgeB